MKLIPKIMQVKREEIKIGDVVVCDAVEAMYLVMDYGETRLHHHPFFKCAYTCRFEPSIRKWMMQDLAPVKTIIRLVEESQKSTKPSKAKGA